MTEISPETELDLTPRAATPDATQTRSWRNAAIIGALLVVAGFIVYQALTSARVYYLNVDEAIARQVEFGSDEFMMQGTVLGEPATAADGALIFTVAYNDSTVDVRHVGPEPTDLFRDGEKVLSRGRWQGDIFQSEQLIVKHSEEYIEDNPDRIGYELDEAEADASGSSSVE